MGAFLYFVEGRPAIGPADLAALGLADVGKGASLAFAGTSQGPSGKAGVVFAFAGDNPRYLPAVQTWRIAPGGKYWLGLETEDPPGPDDVLRQTAYPGHFIELNDGHRWLIPVARVMGGGTTLPTRYILGANGRETQVMPEFVEISRRAGEAFDLIYNREEDKPLVIPKGIALAEAALGINYRLGEAEILMLGLLGEHNYSTVIEYLCDFPSLRRMRDAIAKKNGLPGSESLTPGEKDSTETTCLPGPTTPSLEK